MKLKRNEFKAMLKECILELVQEGKLFQDSTAKTRSSGIAPTNKLNEATESSGIDGITPNTRLNEAVKLTTQLVSKGDPKKSAMYQNIIADTAKTTLQKQLANQMTGGGALMEGAVLPEERALDQAQLGMFAANQRWAQLAFGGKTKSSSGQ
jgi:hypothetical protein